MPPPVALVRAFSKLQARAYRRSGGRRRGTYRDRPILLLTTTGRRSGRPRTAPLVFIREGEAWCVVGSFAGHGVAPRWEGNLRADPRAEVQVGEARVPVTGRFAEGEEYARLWQRFLDHSPGYRDYRAATDRHFPIAVLSPRDAGAAGGGETDRIA